MGKKQDIALVVYWEGQDYEIQLGQKVRYLGTDDGKGGYNASRDNRSGQVGIVDEVLIARDNRSGRNAGVTITVEFPDGQIRRSLACLHQLEFLGEQGQQVQRKPKRGSLEEKAARYPGNVNIVG